MRVALVTGASRPGGIGAAVVRRLAADGLRVVVHGWPPSEGEADVVADLGEPDAPERVVEACLARHGRIDVVVANHARSSSVRLGGLTAAEVDATLAVNVRATLLLARVLAERRPGAERGGRLVLFTSGQYHGAMADELPYVASKAALHGLTKSLAIELAPRGITVNCVDPGPTDTGYADAARAEEVKRLAPRGRWGTPEEAARLVGWLVSEEADWVTGQVIASDGGWSARPRAG
jgi:3-oxoacyl-[acyl-carrier protein] reductase